MCVIAMARAGYDIALTYRVDRQAALDTVGEAEKLGAAAVLYALDVSHGPDVSAVVREVVGRFGRIDALAHCAGIGQRQTFAALTEEIWDRTIAVNLTGTFLVLKAVIPVMQAQEAGGKIALLGSLSARIGGVVNAAYTASKRGMEGLAKYLVQEVGPRNININVVAPSIVATEMFQALNSQGELSSIAETIPMRRFALPEEVASVVQFLLSDGGAYINGETIYVSGGR